MINFSACHKSVLFGNQSVTQAQFGVAVVHDLTVGNGSSADLTKSTTKKGSGGGDTKSTTTKKQTFSAYA